MQNKIKRQLKGTLPGWLNDASQTRGVFALQGRDQM